MDEVRQHDLQDARDTPPARKLQQALDMMRAGLALQRDKLRRALPEATPEELDRAFEAWLLDGD